MSPLGSLKVIELIVGALPAALRVNISLGLRFEIPDRERWDMAGGLMTGGVTTGGAMIVHARVVLAVLV
jgi:hypothetical protein